MIDLPLNRRRFLGVSAGAFAAASLGNVALGAPSPIRIGVGSDPVFAAFYLADQEGLFKAENVDVSVQLYTDGGEAMNALVAQQVDVSVASEPSSLIRLARAPLRPLAISYQSGRYVKLVLGKGVVAPKDIKRFGVVKGTISEYCAGLSLPVIGLDPSKVSFIPSGPPELPALLARGDIDAYFCWEPWATNGLAQGGRIAMTSGEVGYRDTLWVTATAAALESNPQGLQGMLRAIAKASKVITDDPKRAAIAVKKATRLPEESTLKLLQQMTLTVRDFEEEDYKSYDKIAQFLADNNVTKGIIPYRTMLQPGFYKG
ncbi:ABC transporter substrate-binding protein [Rhizobium rhizoryzae]|uniref:NitT/TauT family transport system substrate-binding protein n=1 Tax=Rhizobium rhizoryzae TaxID=451876 RepID=A0A7W6LK08_9HYPH|nr:ABC transporter substrate-binding protein [Rhizobium rhizoryzae]MBB4145656.1 NitT/TauT family transport system substrate-binding protein [Rhizobium rhizoryzae]